MIKLLFSAGVPINFNETGKKSRVASEIKKWFIFSNKVLFIDLPLKTYGFICTLLNYNSFRLLKKKWFSNIISGFQLVINFTIDLKENGGRGVGHWEPPSLPLQNNNKKNPAPFNDLNILRLQNPFPKYSVVRRSYVPPPAQKKSIFLFHSFLLS